MTAYELETILGDASLLGKTTFIQNGQTVAWNGTGFIAP